MPMKVIVEHVISMVFHPPQRQWIFPSSQNLGLRRTEAGSEAGGWNLNITRCVISEYGVLFCHYFHTLRASLCCTCMASPTVVPTTIESDCTKLF